jgi:tRNA-specific 2-thiouridylase
MKTWGFMEVGGAPKHESGCCSLDAIFDAKSIATKFDFPHYTVDFTKAFEETVINDFVDEYLDGRTPNPCVVCNRKIKWEELLQKADSLDAYYVATGHYANLEFNETNNRYLLKNSADSKKDQTYALWGLSQESLSRTLFPLGKYKKTEVRELAEELGIKTANKPDSQEICFVADNNYERFLRERVPEKIENVESGDLIYQDKKIGNHKGIPFYTIGQRKGLGVALGKPVYVKNIDKQKNVVELGDDGDLYSQKIVAEELNFVSQESLLPDTKVIAKIRYSDRGSLAIVKEIDTEKIVLEFIEPKRAITPGQSLVLYDEQGYLLAGGIISKEN